MKSIIRSFLLLAVILAGLSMKMDKPVRIVFFGDSITQMGVDPGGYIDRMKGMLKTKGLESSYELIGAGIGGNKVYDLYFRMEQDVLAKAPDIVVIWVGVNDVWHKSSFGTGTDPDKFEKFYDGIIQKFKKSGIQVVLCTPTTIGEKTDYSNQQDGDLNRYSGIIRKLADKDDCRICDLRKIFHEYELEHNPDNLEKGILTTDGVHLNETGNQLAAEKFFNLLIAK